MTPESPLESHDNPPTWSYHPALLENLDGANHPIFSLDWSPSGRLLAWAGEGQIHVWDSLFRQEIAAFQAHGMDIWGLAWSPDGAALASACQDGTVKLWSAADWQNAAGSETAADLEPGAGDHTGNGSPAAADRPAGPSTSSGLPTAGLPTAFHPTAVLETGEYGFCVSWSPDGKRLAVGTGAFTDETRPETFSGKAKIYNVETQQLVHETGVSSFIISAAWSPDGRVLAIGQLDGQITFWDGWTDPILARTELKTLPAAPETAGAESAAGALRADVNGLAWSPYGWMLASAHQDGMVRVWRPETGEILKTFADARSWLRGIAWSPNGKLLASAGGDAEIRVWQVATGHLLASLPPASLPIWSLKWSPDGKYLAAGEGLYQPEPAASRVLVYQMPVL